MAYAHTIHHVGGWIRDDALPTRESLDDVDVRAVVDPSLHGDEPRSTRTVDRRHVRSSRVVDHRARRHAHDTTREAHRERRVGEHPPEELYTLTGSTAIGGAEVAAALGAAIGKWVKYVPIPVPAMVESVAKAGLDDYMQVMLRDYFNAYSRGWISQVTSTVKDITGNPPRSIDEFARDFARTFGGR